MQEENRARHRFRAVAALCAMLAGVLLSVPAQVDAHERQVFAVGDQVYQFIIGSLGEPVVVDDKSGVYLSIFEAAPDEPTNYEADGREPAEGLQETLQVELQAGPERRVLPLEPAHGQPGTYEAPFFPTVETTLTYRVFGTLNSIPFDVSFTCSPAGHPESQENAEPTPVSDGVTRLYKTGSFGCPLGKAAMGFPEPSVALNELASRPASEPEQSEEHSLLYLALALGAAGTVLGALALLRRRR